MCAWREGAPIVWASCLISFLYMYICTSLLLFCVETESLSSFPPLLIPQIIVMYLQVLECERNQTLVQTAW